MTWDVAFDAGFAVEVANLPSKVANELLAHALVLAEFGPQLGRPRCDTLNGSQHANMKELRFKVDKGQWRVAFAFDPKRKAILLAAGNKTGADQRRFYEELIRTADARFTSHLEQIQGKQKGRGK